METPLVLDLTPAAADAFLRKVAFGRGGEPCELGLHRMRCIPPAALGEPGRVLGLRLRGVAFAASQAYRLDPETGSWLPDAGDFAADLGREDLAPPVVQRLVIGAAETRSRIESEADALTYYGGGPLVAFAQLDRAPVLLELIAEDLHPLTEERRRVRLFVAAAILELRDARGALTPEDVLAEAAAFRAAWETYWEARRRDPAHPEDLHLEWMVPDDFRADDLPTDGE